MLELTSPEWRRGRLKPEQCLIDDAELIIGEALKSYLGVEVIAATLTDQLKENKKIYEQTSKMEYFK